MFWLSAGYKNKQKIFTNTKYKVQINNKIKIY